MLIHLRFKNCFCFCTKLMRFINYWQNRRSTWVTEYTRHDATAQDSTLSQTFWHLWVLSYTGAHGELMTGCCGSGPTFKPLKSVVDLWPAALPLEGRFSCAQCSLRIGGKFFECFCASSGASINCTAKPISKCHSMWPDGWICRYGLFQKENKWGLTMEEPGTWVVRDET